MRQHHAFGVAGAPAREDHCGQVIHRRSFTRSSNAHRLAHAALRGAHRARASAGQPALATPSPAHSASQLRRGPPSASSRSNGPARNRHIRKALDECLRCDDHIQAALTRRSSRSSHSKMCSSDSPARGPSTSVHSSSALRPRTAEAALPPSAAPRCGPAICAQCRRSW